MYQDAATFSAKTTHLRGPASAEFVDYIYVDGPFTIVPPILARKAKRPSAASSASMTASSKPKRVRCAKKTTEFRAWWRPLGIHQTDASHLDDDRDELLIFLREKLDELGEIDGVMGFSQGASLAAWMCSEQVRAVYDCQLGVRRTLAVLIGSYLGSPQYSLESGILPDIASLHLFGSNDHVIPATKSQQVVDYFQDAQVGGCALDSLSMRVHAILGPVAYARACFLLQTREDQVLTSTHNQGHVIPKCDASRERFQSFLAQQQLDLFAEPSTSSSTSPETNERERLASSPSTAERACML
ncbi:hypothetical protein BBJ28_00010223 [Nothophytophthora sp. Chile5]|nr:hypothetical protein BBJ28_00010223 [Nothophytophthora sp. Chile5]